MIQWSNKWSWCRQCKELLSKLTFYHLHLHVSTFLCISPHFTFYILGQLYGAYRRPMDAIFFFAFRSTAWDFDVVTYLLGTTMWNLSSWQSPKKFGFPSTPSCPAWTEKRKNSLLKRPNHRWLPKEESTVYEKQQQHDNYSQNSRR